MKTAIVTTLLFATCATSLSAQFAPGVAISSSVTDVQELRVVDLNGDTHQDVVVRQSNAIGWFANDGNGIFSALDTIHVSQGELGAFDFADTQSDGGMDLVVADVSADAILLLVNDGAGSFGPPLELVELEGSSVRSLVLADISGDDLPEVVYRTELEVDALENEGGTFGPAELLFSVGGLQYGLLVWDINADDALDIVYFSGIEGVMNLSLNPGDLGGPWGGSPGYIPSPGQNPLVLLDVDGDGDLDLADVRNPWVQWIEFEADSTLAIPYVEEGGEILAGAWNNYYRTGWAARLGCGPGASMLWTDSIGEPVQWATYDAVLENFGPVSVLSDLPSFQAIHSGDLNGDGKEDLVLWDGEGLLTWHRNLIEEPTQEVLITPFDTLCNASVPYILDHGQQEGGTWSGAGVDSGAFTPATAGEFELVYTLLDPESGCPYSGARTMVVINTATMTADTELNDICATGQIQLTGIPAGGAWSGAANVLGVIDNDTLTRPFMGGIYYTYTDASGSECQSGEMYQLQPFSPLGYTNPGLFCSGDSVRTFVISGTMSGGVGATGTAVLSVVYNPPSATVTIDPNLPAGEYEIVLTSLSPMTCLTTLVDTIRVVPSPVVGLTMADLCANGSAIALVGQGVPAGGMYFLDGAADTLTQIEPSAVTSGMHELIYTYEDENMCMGAAVATFSVLDPPLVSLSLSFDTFLIGQDPIALSGGEPQGGVYVIGQDTVMMFDPNGHLAGDAVPVHYTFTDTATGCSATASDTVIIDGTVGIGESGFNMRFGLRPNPTSGEVRFRSPVNGEYHIFNGAGGLVQRGNVRTGEVFLNVGTLPAGVYWLEVSDATQVQREPLVITR